MRRTIAGVCFFVGTSVFSGCGSNADGLMKDQIKTMNDLAEAIETDAPKAKLDEINKRGEDLKKKFEDLKLSEEEKKKLQEKYKDEFTKALQRLMTAQMKKMGSGFGSAFGSGFKMP